MRRIWALLALALAVPVFAGTTSGSFDFVSFGGEGTPRIRAKIAVLPDLQNYCTSVTGNDLPSGPTAAELAIGPNQLDQLAADVIAWDPDFVLQTGDVADQSGSNESEGGGVDDPNDLDNSVLFPLRYGEYACIKTHLFDKLDAAGIPWLAASGNHDSYRDFELAFPRTEFLAKSYAYSAQNEVDRWHAGYNDTEQRAALMPTPIGTICAVTEDYQIDPAGGTLDASYFVGAIGCGAGRPTIGVRHFGALSGMTDAANAEFFMRVNGHATPTIPGSMQTVSNYGTPGGFEIVDLFTNSQELSLTCGPTGATPGDGTDIHTGGTWWTMVEIVPAENAIFVQARNPIYGGTSRDPKCGNSYENAVVTLSPSFCTRFPGGPGC